VLRQVSQEALSPEEDSVSQDIKELERQYREAQERGLLPGSPPPRKQSERLYDLCAALRWAEADARAEVMSAGKSALERRCLRSLATLLGPLAFDLGEWARDLEDEGR
jgi:hypothetical protein